MPARTSCLQPVTQSKQSRSRLQFDKMFLRRQEGDAVMSCLMEQLARGSPAMTKECGDVLMQIHYFLARWAMSSLSFCSKHFDSFFDCCVTVTIFDWKLLKSMTSSSCDAPWRTLTWKHTFCFLQGGDARRPPVPSVQSGRSKRLQGAWGLAHKGKGKRTKPLIIISPK